MAKYKVKEEFDWQGEAQAVDSVIELEADSANALVEEGKIEPVGDEGAGDAAGGEEAANTESAGDEPPKKDEGVENQTE